MTHPKDCSTCPNCIFQRNGKLLADANAQLIGISAFQIWHPKHDAFQVLLKREDIPEEDQFIAMCDLMGAALLSRAHDPTVPKKATGWKTICPRFTLNVSIVAKVKDRMQMDVSFITVAEG